MSTANGTGRPVKFEPTIKPDPETTADTPTALSEIDDIYEDAGDLDFTKASQNIFLTRLPKFLWERWNELDDDEEVQIGTLRVNADHSKVACLQCRDYLYKS
jgi:transcription initiation factor TFIIF subunit beta